ncbi:MAG: hypothetical protein ACLGSH_18170 [Acidobacteriota bacterium]
MATITECWKGSQSRFVGLRRHMAKRQLENELASIIRTVAGHKRNKVPDGAPQYKSLWLVADRRVDEFCRRYSVDRATVQAQIPALAELKSLATTAHTTTAGVKAAGAVVTGFVVFIFLGFVFGIAQYLFHLGLGSAQWLEHFL